MNAVPGSEELGDAVQLSVERVAYIIFLNITRDCKCSAFQLVTCMVSLSNVLEYCPDGIVR